MQKLRGRWVYSASDLIELTACEHLTTLRTMQAEGRLLPPERDAVRKVLERQGEAHEQRTLAGFELSGRRVFTLPKPAGSAEGLEAAQAATARAMSAGAEVIHGATFFDGRFRGHPDFLLRVEEPSALGGFSYEVVDAKLARRVRAGALLQLCAYSDALAKIQERPPQWMHVALGSGQTWPFRVREYAPYFGLCRERMEARLEAFESSAPTEPVPVRHCGFCDFESHCERFWEEREHVSLVASIRGAQLRKLRRAGIETLSQLVAAPSLPEAAGLRLSERTLRKLQAQAALQLQQRSDGAVRYELLEELEPDRGLSLLPPPSPGDLFFDMEGDPFGDEGGREYLFGLVDRLGTAGVERFHAFWGHTLEEERRAFEAVMDLFAERLRADPELHIYHYASYETAALKKLASRHQTRVEQLDALLRGKVFVDLYQVVRQALRVSQDSYGIKSLEPLYMEARTGSVKNAASSMVAYETWLETGAPSILEEIADYNRLDCSSTGKLRDWLEARRSEAETRFGVVLARPEAGRPEREEARAQSAATAALSFELLEGRTEPPAATDREGHGRWLLAQLLDWHRREARPEWWAYFERLAMTQDQLFGDSEALAGLTWESEREDGSKGLVRRYRFDPAQEHKIFIGTEPIDPRSQKRAGKVISLDGRRGAIELKSGRGVEVATALVPPGPLPDGELRAALMRLGRSVIFRGIDGDGPYRAARDLLLGLPPRLSPIQTGPLLTSGETPLDGCIRLGLSLERGCLPIQGPPGSGKSYTGARMIVAALERGKRVGIAAHSHKVICNMLRSVLEVAQEKGLTPRVLQKCQPEQRLEHPSVLHSTDAKVLEAAAGDSGFQVLAGTAWLWAREGMEGAVDLLFVDEAGQFSLANALAISGAAPNLVLLGDPQQLAQPSKGTHPEGAELSALEKVLDGRATVDPSRGVLLDVSYRMHPELCARVSQLAYEGRLRADSSCARQRLEGAGGGLDGTGVRFAPVYHSYNRSRSREEAAKAAELVARLLGARWTDRSGRTRPLSLEDLLVISPYNAQVAALQEALPSGARVGTVDRFQGQEAPVVLYSTGTSSADLVPRGLEFLFDLRRLNVALSRARGLFILIASPELLRAQVSTPEEMRRVSTFCALVEQSPRV